MFSKDFTNHRKKTNRRVVFSCWPFPNHGWELSTMWKQDSFRHLLKISASMYQSLGSQLYRTTTGIKSGSDESDPSRSVMTFLTILGVIKTLSNFRLVLEGKKGKKIPESSRLKFLEKFLANKSFCFISCSRQQSLKIFFHKAFLKWSQGPSQSARK